MTSTLLMSSRFGISSPHEVLRSCRPRRAWDPAAILRGDPEPWLASLLRSLHELDEPLEQVCGVMRSSCGLRVVLHGVRRDVEALDPLDHLVVEADVRDAGPPVGGVAVAVDGCVDREPVVVGGHLDLASR